MDLDIIFYDDAEVADDNLVIPHARWQERSFVQAPVCDLFTDEELGLEHAAGVNTRLKAVRRLWQLQGGALNCGLNKPCTSCPTTSRVYVYQSGMQSYPGYAQHAYLVVEIDRAKSL